MIEHVLINIFMSIVLQVILIYLLNIKLIEQNIKHTLN